MGVFFFCINIFRRTSPLLEAATLSPSCTLVIHPVKFAKDDKGNTVSGYVFSLIPSFEETKMPFEEVCKRVILQRMVVMENDQAVQYLKYWDTNACSSYLQ
jgi:hypothetical protein